MTLGVGLDALERAKRARTLGSVVRNVLTALVIGIAGLSAVLRDVGAGLQADPAFEPSILEPLEILGIDGFGEWALQVKVRIKTVPLKQWEVGRELRRRIVKAFGEHGFAIPFPAPSTAVRPGHST